MTLESADEVVIIEEQIEPMSRGERDRMARLRLAGVVVGGLGLSLAVTVVVRRLVTRRRSMRGRRRGSWLSIQPRTSIFAPYINVSLPFSGIVGQEAPDSRRAARKRQARPRRQMETRLLRAQRRGRGRAQPRRLAWAIPGR